MSRVKSTSTLTVSWPIDTGAWVRHEGGPTLRVTSCTGSGPYTLTVVPVTRWRRWALRARLLLTDPFHAAWQQWKTIRCEPHEGRCWRKARVGDYCDRHWLDAIEHGRGEA